MKYLDFLKKHKLALFAAVVIGIICIAPHIVFRISLGGDYRGIYLMQTANELEYLGRMQEIADGHWTLGSAPFFEYKDNSPLMPPSVLEVLTVAISRVFKVSMANIVILDKFFLPAILFLLIYFLIHQLTENKESIGNRINAIGGGLLIVLGYDLIDYRTVINYLKGISMPNDFLLWTRPINPILGALLIFSFLLAVWSLYKNETGRHGRIFLAGLILAFAITSYFFSWGIILSFAGVLAIIGLLKSKRKFVKKLIFVILIAFILALPYFYNAFTAMKDPSYQRSALSIGLFLNHEPILNKFLIFSLLIFVVLTLLNRKNIGKDWWFFSLAFILSGFVAFNQQIVTGRTIWPFHFVQYTIPLSIAAVFIIFYNVFGNAGKKLFYIWLAVIIFVIAASLSFGIYIQASTYKQSYSAYKERQKYSELFNWINRNTQKDCVILAEGDDFLNGAIPAFTHCNVYSIAVNGFLTPFGRIYHNYFVYLRMEGIGGDEIADYLDKNGAEAAIYLYGTEGLSHGASSPSFVAVKNKIIADYKDFSKKDFRSELLRYKLDYIATEGKLSDEMKDLIRSLKLVYFLNNVRIYRFE